jgi:hypothetical protein
MSGLERPEGPDEAPTGENPYSKLVVDQSDPAESTPEAIARAETIAHESAPEHERLRAAREQLDSIETGKESAKDGAWDRAKDAVDDAKLGVDEALDRAARTDDAGTEPAPVGPESAEPQLAGAEATAEAPAYIVQEYMPDGSSASTMSEPYRAAANEHIARMLADQEYANELLSKDGLGRDFTSEGISEVMAAFALPYLKRAEEAEKNNQPERAAAYREKANARANGIARSMDLDRIASIGAKVGAEVSVGTAPIRPGKRNAMKERSFFEKRGISWKALLRRG